VLYNGVYIVPGTTDSRFVWEHAYYPQFYVPRDALEASGKLQVAEGDDFVTDDGKNVGKQLTLKVGDKSTDKVIHFSDSLTGNAKELAGLVKIDYDSVDQWFEEDTPIFVHPKDPFKRIDILASKRPVRVLVDGQVVAESSMVSHLYEGFLPVRYYIPFTAVDASVLRPSKTRTRCPYKGEAEYYSVEVNGKLHEDIIWYYRTPTLESGPIVGLVCCKFQTRRDSGAVTDLAAVYNEKVDIELDGKKLERPDTHFGKSKPSENKKPSAL